MTKTVLSYDDFDNAQAVREGWALFNANGVLKIQCIDEPDLSAPAGEEGPTFPTDEYAVRHVTSAAAAGSAYHRMALRLNRLPASSHIELDVGQDVSRDVETDSAGRSSATP